MEITTRLLLLSKQSLPRAGLLFDIPNRYPFVDRVGANTRPLYGLQYLHLAGATDFTNESITGTETVTSQPAGTAAIAVSAGKLTIGAGDLWSFALSNGSTYEFGTILTATTGVVFDTSGNGRHLSFTVADTAAVCISGSREKGCDALNTYGYVSKIENRYIRSENIINGAWTKGSVSFKKFPIIGPFLKTSDYKMVANATNSPHLVTQLLKPNTNYLISFHAHEDELSVVQVMSHATSTQYANFDLSQGVVSAHGSAMSVYGIVDVGNGWYRCYATVQTGGSGDISIILCPAPTSWWSPSFLGDGISGLYIDYIQAELSTGQTSPAPYFTTELSPELPGIHPPVYGTLTESAISRTNVLVSVEGDSRSGESSPTNIFWHSYLAEYLGIPNVTIRNSATGGDSLKNMNAGYNYLDSLTPMAPTGKCGFFVLIGGVNDLMVLARTGEQAYTDACGLWAKARADGYIVVASTEAGSTGMNAEQITERDAYNALVRSDSTKYDILIEPDVYVPVSNASYYSDGTHLTDVSGGRALASMIADAIRPVAISRLQVEPLRQLLKSMDGYYPGQAKYNITPISHPSDTTITLTHTYSLADAHQIRTALGWTWGVDHWAFTSTGIPKEVPGSVLIANGGGDQFFCGSKRIAGYSSIQVEPALTKIKRLTGGLI